MDSLRQAIDLRAPLDEDGGLVLQMLERRLGEHNILEIPCVGLTLAEIQRAVRYDDTMPGSILLNQLVDKILPVSWKTNVERLTEQHQ
eukprot:2330932-Alexandrium_andersonii.AAC.1